MKTVDIEMWPREKTTNWIEERIAAHLLARANPESARCSSSDTWEEPLQALVRLFSSL